MGSRLTNSSDETEIAGLFSRDLVFSIPYFQRAYKWSKVKVEQFEKDLLSLADLTDSNHFLGAIIVFGRLQQINLDVIGVKMKIMPLLQKQMNV